MKMSRWLWVLFPATVLCGCATNREPLGSAEFYPLLHLAAWEGDALSARILLERGADPTGFRDYEACYKKYGYGTEPSSHLFTAAYAGQFDIVRLLVEAGAKLDTREGEGCTPLWGACAKGHLEVVKYLVARGAHSDIKGKD